MYRQMAEININLLCLIKPKIKNLINSCLLYINIMKPIWTYWIQLCGCIRKSNINSFNTFKILLFDLLSKHTRSKRILRDLALSSRMKSMSFLKHLSLYNLVTQTNDSRLGINEFKFKKKLISQVNIN